MEPAMDDDQFVCAFEEMTLPFEQWTHRAHVIVAYTYLCRLSFDEALVKMRDRVKAYNAHNKVPETQVRGYNETTTRAFLHLIAATMAAYGDACPTTDADSFCNAHPQLMTRHVLRLFYSPKQRMHPLAKTQFVEPDLTPLPRIRSTNKSKQQE
jgi:hypothetical protein